VNKVLFVEVLCAYPLLGVEDRYAYAPWFISLANTSLYSP